MPLLATGVPAFLSAHPTWDGRGVLIAILDSGVDPGVPGLDSTSTGRPKLLDVRDFSGEGRVELTPIVPQGDAVVVMGQRLTGFGRMRALAASGPWYGGALRERLLGLPPASDLNDNGLDSDTLAVVVGKASDGWLLFADTDGDGSFANERPVHDYLMARERFGWHRPGGAPLLTLAANVSESARGLELALVFDTEAHGTHVAGIAAGHGIGAVAGFDGVAPGAQLLGLKISRNDFGGLTTSGSVLAALDYALRFAAARRLPLVVNMSFGVGNEREGTARLDGLLDSALAAHPEVVFITAAGNDGPGMSTIGFPGSMRRGITVGATQPAAFFTPPGRGAPRGPDPLLFFSARGGELGKPDLVAPGTAYSTVPGWNFGEEFKSGTSMASPHVAGLAAILLSAAQAQGRSVNAEDLRRALAGGARPLPGQGTLAAGAGIPNLEEAWRVLQSPAPAATFDVELADHPGSSASYQIGGADSLVRFRIRRTRGSGSLELTLHSEVPWLSGPATVTLDGPESIVTLTQRPPVEAGVHSGAVTATAAGIAGPIFRLLSTVVIPEARQAGPVRVGARLAPGTERRAFFAADSGRPFRVRMATRVPGENLIAALHQPGGSPILGENGIPGGADTAAAVYDIDGRDALRGYYEAVAVAPPGSSATINIAIDHAPVGLALAAVPGDSVAITIRPLGDSAIAGRLNLGLLGGEQSVAVSGAGGGDVRVPFRLPPWARQLIVDLELDPEQWSHFTDFGLTALDSAGRILDKAPANYAHSRLSVALAPGAGDQDAAIVLAPGFAEPGSSEQWAGRVTIRLYADHPVAIETREGDEFTLADQQRMVFHARLGEPPWPLPEAFRPLGLLLVEAGGISWTWEWPIPRVP
jgi:subtilisin family serine protease